MKMALVAMAGCVNIAGQSLQAWLVGQKQPTT